MTGWRVKPQESAEEQRSRVLCQGHDATFTATATTTYHRQGGRMFSLHSAQKTTEVATLVPEAFGNQLVARGSHREEGRPTVSATAV